MKNLVLLIILAIFLTSCKGSENAFPPVLIPIATSSATEPPFAPTPPTPTPITTLSNVDFAFPTAFSSFYNQFPLSIIPQTEGYFLHCVFDADQIEYKSVRIDNVEIRKWVKCYFFTSTHEVDYVTIPLQVINWDDLTWFRTFADEDANAPIKNPGQCVSSNECGYAEIIPEDKHIALHFEWTNLAHKYIIKLGFGNKPADSDSSQKFFKSLTSQSSQEYLDKFVSTGDAANLPPFDYLEHFLLAYDYFPYVSK